MDEILAELKAIRAEISHLRGEIRKIKGHLSMKPDILTRKDICNLEGIAVSTGNSQPWIFPYFGETQYLGKPSRWDRDVYIEWKKTPFAKRKKVWKEKEGIEDFKEMFNLTLTQVGRS